LTQLSFAGVRVDFGTTRLLDGVTFTVTRGERWGIIGRNGAGKTTLFRLVTGELRPASGTVARASGLRISLMDQQREFADAATVWEAAAGPFRSILELERSLAEQAAALAEAGDRVTEQALARYDRDLERFQREDGYSVAARVDAVLHGLGFDPDDARRRPPDSLSGGERGRLGLVRQLVAPADLLLLDEPTNHLDLETTRWLEGHLRQLDATVMVVSHDRAFLQAVVDHVLHLEAGTAQQYGGDYEAFVRQRTERRLAQQRAVARQARVIAAEEDYIRRNIAGQNSAQAKGRRRRLQRIGRLSPPAGDEGSMALRLEADERGGDQVLVASDVGLTVAGRALLHDFTGRISRGEVVGLIGPNGAGKSTFLLDRRRSRAGRRRDPPPRLGAHRLLPAGPRPGARGPHPLRDHRRSPPLLGPRSDSGPPRPIRFLRRHGAAPGGIPVRGRDRPGGPRHDDALRRQLPHLRRAHQPPGRRVH
jgi:ATP-binding cassette subfamily F protein 3